MTGKVFDFNLKSPSKPEMDRFPSEQYIFAPIIGSLVKSSRNPLIWLCAVKLIRNIKKKRNLINNVFININKFLQIINVFVK